MINASNDLTEASLVEQVNNFVTVCEMITFNNIVVTTLIVVAKIVRCSTKITEGLSRILPASEVDVRIIHDFTTLEDIELMDV